MGDLIQLRDYQNPKDLARMYSEQTLEQQAVGIISEVLSGEPGMCGMEPVIHIEIPYGGQGIDGMWTDTAPSEYCAPESDPA